jgi:DNA-binding response OmpR family regulator
VSSGSADTTVLVVDDEPEVADAYAFRIQHEYGASTETAYGGAAALDALDDGIDVVLLDRRMPELSGDEVLAELRDRGHETPVIMITAVVDPGFDVLEMPFDDYLCKPVDSEDLFAAIDSALTADEYGDRADEYFSIASKLAVLEADHAPEELADHEGYQRLSDRADELEGVLADRIEEFDDMRTAFTAINRSGE